MGWLFSDRRYPDEPVMPGLATLAMVEATTERDGRTNTVRRYYLSSATLSAARFAAAVRAHWRIENALHWVLDTGFDDDGPATDAIMGQKISPPCGSSPSTFCAPRGPISRSAASESAQVGPMTSLAPSSAICDCPGRGWRTTCLWSYFRSNGRRQLRA